VPGIFQKAISNYYLSIFLNCFTYKFIVKEDFFFTLYENCKLIVAEFHFVSWVVQMMCVQQVISLLELGVI
jgi:hypothetical protein